MPATTFHPFPNLPAELRIEIWRFAAAATLTNTSKPVCIFPEDPDDDGIVFETGSPAMLATSKEARQVTLECCVPRAYDPIADILYVPPSRFPSFCRRCGLDPFSRSVLPSLAWVTEIRHLAIDRPYPDLDSLTRALSNLTSLQTISVVFPRSTLPSGEGDCLDKTNPGPPRKRAGLHLQQALDVYDEVTANANPDRSHMQEIRGYYRRIDSLWRNRDDSVKHFPWIDLDKMSQELQAREGKSLGDELAHLEFELNKEVLQHLWQCFRYVQYLRRVPEWPRLRYEARFFSW